jgi:nitroreductase
MTTAIHHPWEVSQQDFPSTNPIQEQLKFLLQYAILAPSSKNTQPWKFSVAGDTIAIFADLSCWQPVADRDRRELYNSLGCALENLLVAAEHFGFRHEVRYFPQPSDDTLAAVVTLYPGGTPSEDRPGSGLHSITARHTQRGVYRDEAVPEALRRGLLASGSAPGLRVDLTDDPLIFSRVVELNLQADEMEFADPMFRKELGTWVAQGSFGASGLLSRIRGFLLARVNLGAAVGRHNAAVLSSAPLLGLISARRDDPMSQVQTGQALERLWLHATRLGLALQPMGQALEIPSLRAEFARIIPELGWVPEQVFRVGYPLRPERGHTPRRLLDQVLVG